MTPAEFLAKYKLPLRYKTIADIEKNARTLMSVDLVDIADARWRGIIYEDPDDHVQYITLYYEGGGKNE